MQRKAVVLDLDGTLLNSHKSVSPNTLQAVLGFIQTGNLAVIATARPLRTVMRLLPQELRSCHLVLCNGAWIVREETVVYRNEIPPCVVLRLTAELARIGLQPGIEAEDRLYSDLKGDAPSPWVYSPLNEYPGTPACKVLTHVPAGIDMAVLDAIIPPDLAYVITDQGTLMQIARRSCSKAAACSLIFHTERVDMANTYAFGDDTNDISVFEAVGMGIAMENAATELKKVAHAVTTSNDADGVAAGIAKFVLGQGAGDLTRMSRQVRWVDTPSAKGPA